MHRINLVNISIFLIFLLKIGLLFLPSFKIDMNVWQAWSGRLFEVGPINFYSPNYFADYFPGYLYMLWGLSNIFHLFFSDTSFHSNTYELLIKGFTLIFDFLTAFIIFKIVSRVSKNWGKIAAIFYLINPAVLFNSSVWGQVDSIMTFFLIFSLYQLIELKTVVKSSLALSIASLIKPQSIIILPVYVIILLKKNLKSLLTFFIILFVFSILLAYPFLISDPIFGLYNLFSKSVSVYEYTSLFAYNLWGLFGWWQSDKTNFLFLNLQQWGNLIFLIAVFICSIPLFINKSSKNLPYLTSALIIFSFFLFPTRIHERYLFPFFAIFITYACLLKSRKLLILYSLLAVIHFLNLWYVYYYYNFVFNNPNLEIFFVFTFLEKFKNVFIFLNLFVFFILIYDYYRGVFKFSYFKKIYKQT